MKSKLTAPGTERLNLLNYEPPSRIAFKFDWRRYNEGSGNVLKMIRSRVNFQSNCNGHNKFFAVRPVTSREKHLEARDDI
jgi:hypothetical protein